MLVQLALLAVAAVAAEELTPMLVQAARALTGMRHTAQEAVAVVVRAVSQEEPVALVVCMVLVAALVR